MTYYRNTGTKISEYTKLEINDTNNKFPHAPSFICYALNMSGTNGINKNYQVPMQSIRTDVRGFVGLRNAKPQWNNMLSVWYGEYQSSNPNNSYVKEWTDEYKYATNEGYVADKFEDTRDGRDIETSRVFLLKNIPFPFEETTPDPKSSTHKIVDKKYVDQRLNGIRKVKFEKEEIIKGEQTEQGYVIHLRPYQCLYYSDDKVDEEIIIYQNNLENDTTGQTALNDKMFLEFYIEIPKTSSSNLSIKVYNNGSFTPVKWSFKDQLKSIIEASTDRVLIKCFANKSKSTNNQLDVRCTNAMNLEPGKGEGGVSIETTETISKENENSKKIPTQGAVVNYVNNTLNDKLGSTISSITGDDFIEVNEVDDEDPTEVNLSLKLSLNATDVVIDDEDKVPTSKAVYGHTNNQDIHVTKADKNSWNNKVSKISGDDFITTNGEQIVSLSLNTTDEIIDSDVHVPTSNAVYEFTDIIKYYFPELNYEDRKDYIIYDATGNPIYISFADDIVDGTKLFINSNFRKFTLTLPNLTNGNQMFMHNHYLQFVDSDFSKVTDGYRMFRATGSQMFDGDQTGASSPYGNQLKHFRGSLKSLTNGNQMFEGCVLDVDSVCYIIDSLQNENIATANASMTLGIDAQYKSNTTLLNKLNITEGATSTSIKNKNGITWSLTLQWNTRKPIWKYLQQHSK